MKVLLTGAGGFLARECLAELISRGHDVVTTDRRGPVDHIGDLAEGAFCATLPNVDVVVHTAAVHHMSDDLPWIRRRAYFWHNNVEATRQLCTRYSGFSTHFVNIATSMMYEQNGAASYDTNSVLSGQGLYSCSKLAAQEHVNALPNPKTTIIPCIIGGVGREGFFRPFVTLIKNRNTAIIPGTGQHRISMVHVKDVALLIGSVVSEKLFGQFNAAAPEPLTIEQWIDEILSELKLRNVRRIHLPLTPIYGLSALTGFRLMAREQLLMLGQPHVLEIEKSLNVGWKPRYTNAQIVRDIVRYISASTIRS